MVLRTHVKFKQSGSSDAGHMDIDGYTVPSEGNIQPHSEFHTSFKAYSISITCYDIWDLPRAS
jgi:hypothetical protein